MTLRGQNFFSVFITFFTRIESTLNDLHRVPLNFSLPEHIHLICLKIFQTSKNLDLAVKPSPQFNGQLLFCDLYTVDHSDKICIHFLSTNNSKYAEYQKKN